MPIMYELYQEKRRTSPNKDKWYARAKTLGTKDLKDIAEIIQRNASVKRSDVMAVLTELSEVMGDMLRDGYRVKIDGFGAFKIGIRTSPAETEKTFDAGKNIVANRILFQPETEKAGPNGGRARVMAQKVEYKKVL